MVPGRDFETDVVVTVSCISEAATRNVTSTHGNDRPTVEPTPNTVADVWFRNCNVMHVIRTNEKTLKTITIGHIFECSALTLSNAA